MNAVYVSTIAATVALPGRGLALDPGIPHDGAVHRVKIGDPLEIRRRDGSVLSTRVAGLEIGGPPQKKSTAIILPQEIAEAEIPLGAEVWHSDSTSAFA